MKFKVSEYNIFSESGKHIFNMISNSLFEGNIDIINYLKIHHTERMTLENELFDDELLDTLYNHGIIFNIEENEIDIIKHRYYRDKYDDSYLSLILYPTLNCNFDCHYCYEGDKTKKMTDANLSVLHDFLINQSKKKKEIATRWSGGEPLLVWNKIYDLSKKVIENCDINNCKYSSSLISNGYLLTEKILKEMVEVNITSIQITLDGPPKLHDEVRYLSNGKGSFQEVLNGIEIASKYMKVHVRINVDKRNFPEMDYLFRLISNSKANKKNIRIFTRPVECTITTTPSTELFSNEEFINIDKKLIELAIKHELPYAFYWGIDGKKVRCIYHSTNSYLIDPELDIYRCPIFIGGDKINSIGYIDNKNINIVNRSKYLDTLSYSPFEIEECRNCPVLPMCNGKCPIFWESNDKKEDHGCIPDKYNFKNKLDYALSNNNQLLALKNAHVL